MKNVYFLVGSFFVLNALNVAQASNLITYVCESDTRANSGALVVLNNSSLSFFVQNAQDVSPRNLLGAGTLAENESTPEAKVFTQIKSNAGTLFLPTLAKAFRVTLGSDLVVTKIELLRATSASTEEVLSFSQNCRKQN